MYFYSIVFNCISNYTLYFMYCIITYCKDRACSTPPFYSVLFCFLIFLAITSVPVWCFLQLWISVNTVVWIFFLLKEGQNLETRARICKPFKEPSNRFSTWRTTLFCRTGPPGSLLFTVTCTVCLEIYISSNSRNLLQLFCSSVTVHCKGERRKTW